MRTTPIVLAVLIAGGCKPDFATVEEACHDKVPGEGRVEDADAVDTLWRTNCYRRVVKLNRGRLNKQVQAATESHLDYMLQNRTWETGAAFTLETEGNAGFTGTDIYARLDAAEYAFDDPSGMGIWELGIFGDPFTAEERVDYLFADPFWRQVYLQPSWSAAGHAETDTEDGLHVAYSTIVYQYPSVEKENRPIVYPKDGQEDVPYRYVSDTPSDSIYGLGEVGFPITVTFSYSEPSGFNMSEANPYDVHFVSAKLSGGGGDVELHLIEPPGTSPADLLRYTLVAVPLDVLQAGTEYTFTATVTWGPMEKEVVSTFTTATVADYRSEFLGLGRSAPKIFVRHTPPRALLDAELP